MQCVAVLFAVVAVAGFASEASAGEKIRLAQTSTTTNCMMTCNAQAATCQAACFVPPGAVGRFDNVGDRTGPGPRFQSDSEHVVRHELLDDPTHVSDDLRQNIAVAVIGPASNCRD
jgi:hypothetical protein